MTLWRLEILRLYRTHRIWILVAVFASFGVLGPVTARYLPEIIERFGAGMEIAVPPPTPELAMTQYLGNALQLGLLGVAFVAAASLAFDAKPEVAVFLRTRSSILQILTPRYTANVIAAVASFLLGTAIAFTVSAALIGMPSLAGTMAGSLLIAVYLAFFVALTGLAASMVRSVPGAAMIAVGSVILIGIVGLIPPIGPWLPSHLVGGFDALIAGGEFTYWRSVGLTMALSVAAAGASWYLMERREV